MSEPAKRKRCRSEMNSDETQDRLSKGGLGKLILVHENDHQKARFYMADHKLVSGDMIDDLFLVSSKGYRADATRPTHVLDDEWKLAEKAHYRLTGELLYDGPCVDYEKYKEMFKELFPDRKIPQGHSFEMAQQAYQQKMVNENRVAVKLVETRQKTAPIRKQWKWIPVYPWIACEVLPISIFGMDSLVVFRIDTGEQ